MTGRPPRRRLRLAARLSATALVAAAAGLGLVWAGLPDPAPLARQNPRATALIEQRVAEARARGRTLRPRQRWVRLDRVSPRLLEAVILSEDANFYGHDGIDWAAVRDAAEHDLRRGSFARGASTVTQQLAKNLWYGTEKSLSRKLKEALAARRLERALTKRRILALYVNVAEWGEGVFGVEAGALHRFGVPAAELSTAQAVVMASMLPAPRRVDLARPSTWLKRRSRRLLDRMHAAGRIAAAEHAAARAELERILAGPVPADDREEPQEEDAEPVAHAAATSDAPSEPLAPAAPPADAPAAEPAPEPVPASTSGAP